MSKDISNIITSLLEKRGPVPGSTEKEKLEYRFLDSGYVDSFDLIHFIIEIEDTFDITLTPEDTQSENFRTIEGLIKIIKSKIQD